MDSLEGHGASEVDPGGCGASLGDASEDPSPLPSCGAGALCVDAAADPDGADGQILINNTGRVTHAAEAARAGVSLGRLEGAAPQLVLALSGAGAHGPGAGPRGSDG